MGSGTSQQEETVTESPPTSQSNTESESADSSPRPPAILITAPSREDIHCSQSNLTISEASKEQQPSSKPYVVGKRH
ncbi:hypothetical protein JOQ06_003205 [Pogonophryne albipinna]|uniref:Uncharacterized protein n=1 Tax=Pogonophryne albipinna TaxID=1090488 RepID=A0AAD6BAJ0_9TELE|nr:hypothetical protein JOQ06_003205 [Pogonophryne albipinna]